MVIPTYHQAPHLDDVMPEQLITSMWLAIQCLIPITKTPYCMTLLMAFSDIAGTNHVHCSTYSIHGYVFVLLHDTLYTMRSSAMQQTATTKHPWLYKRTLQNIGELNFRMYLQQRHPWLHVPPCSLVPSKVASCDSLIGVGKKVGPCGCD